MFRLSRSSYVCSYVRHVCRVDKCARHRAYTHTRTYSMCKYICAVCRLLMITLYGRVRMCTRFCWRRLSTPPPHISLEQVRRARSETYMPTYTHTDDDILRVYTRERMHAIDRRHSPFAACCVACACVRQNCRAHRDTEYITHMIYFPVSINTSTHGSRQFQQFVCVLANSPDYGNTSSVARHPPAPRAKAPQ